MWPWSSSSVPQQRLPLPVTVAARAPLLGREPRRMPRRPPKQLPSIETRWRPGPRTAAWDELWRRLLLGKASEER